jgi:hypothetical protein
MSTMAVLVGTAKPSIKSKAWDLTAWIQCCLLSYARKILRNTINHDSYVFTTATELVASTYLALLALVLSVI